ncbi:hypothetical protein [Spongiimicrobium salis]|uniref:hypothetical protein n=1 Tax=Spongiimicrobium salis TaxID=1667022 RepID=UPI00374DE70B
MKTTFVLLLTFLSVQWGWAQVNYGTPPADTYPKKLVQLPRIIEVNHFPKINDPIKIKNRYYWKHATAILCKSDEIKIIEYGAYLYYNDQWNLRKSYPLKELDKSFGTRKQRLNQAEPYTWVNNWRIDEKLFGGWALWYFIGTTAEGILVCGYESIYTTANLLNKY